MVAEEREEREGKWVEQSGDQRLSEEKQANHDLETQEAVAKDFGSRWWETNTRTSHGGGDEVTSNVLSYC